MSWPDDGADRQESTTVEARRSAIVTAVRQRGFVTIEALAASHGVTVQTIRRDLNELSAEGRLERYRGGGGLPSSVQNVDYADRRGTLSVEKTRIGRFAANRIPSHCSLFINIGTTTEAVARELTRHDGLSIITNNMHVATTLAGTTDFRIVVAGGSMRRDGALLGPLALDGLAQFRTDYAVIGCSGVDLDGSILDFDFEEVRAARAIIANAKTVLLVADHSKFARRPMARVCSLAEIDVLVTDRPPPPEVTALLARDGVELAIAS